MHRGAGAGLKAGRARRGAARRGQGTVVFSAGGAPPSSAPRMPVRAAPGHRACAPLFGSRHAGGEGSVPGGAAQARYRRRARPGSPARPGPGAHAPRFSPLAGQLSVEDAAAMVLCKPKVLPLKSVSLEKLEKLQRAALEAARPPEGAPPTRP